MRSLKAISRLMIAILVLTTVLVAPVSYANGVYMVYPKIVDFSQGELRFDFVMSALDVANPVVFWVAVPADANTMTADEIMLEASGFNTNYTIKGINPVYGGGTPTEIACTGFTLGEGYKMEIALGYETSPGTYTAYSISAYELYFDAFDFSSPATTPMITQTYSDGYDITMTLSTGGSIIAGVYLQGTTPTAEDLLYASGAAIAYATLNASGGAPEILTIRSSSLLANLDTNIYILKKDKYNNVFFNNSPAIPYVHTSGMHVMSAEYLNNAISNLADDQVKLYFSGALTSPGETSDYLIKLYSEINNQPTPIDLISGTDYVFGNYNPSDFSVTLNITEAGLIKYNNAQYFDNGVMKIGTISGNTIRPYTTIEYALDLNQSIINHQDAPYLTTAAYNEMGTAALDDDAIDLTFTTVNVTQPGIPADYSIEVDTHSISGFTSADITFDPGDYVLSVSGNIVRMSFTTTGVAKLPTAELSFWRVTIKNPNNLTPPSDQTKTYEEFIQFGYNATLAQILVGGMPLMNFTPTTYDYYDVEVPFSAYQTLQGDYSSLITAYAANPSTTITISHDSATGTEKILVSAQGQRSKTYTLHTTVNFMSLSSISIAGQPIVGFNKFINVFSAELVNTTTVIPTLTAVADNPSAVVSVTGSGTLPGVYIYVITVSYSGNSKTYTVNLYAHVHDSTVTNDPDDIFVTPTLPPGFDLTTLPDGSAAPPPLSDADLKYLESLFSQPDFTNNPTAFEQSFNNILGNTLKIQDENQLFLSLTKFDEMVGSMSALVDVQKDNTKVLQDIAKMSQTVETKIQNFKNPEDALTVVDQYLTELSKVSKKTTQSNLEIQKSASEMLQKVADKVSTVPIVVKSTDKQVVVDAVSVQKALDKQVQFLGKVNDLSNKYFGTESVNKVATKVTLEIQKPAELKQVAAAITPEIIQKLAESNVEKLKVEIGGSGLTFNNADISNQKNLVVEMNFLENQTMPEGLENNKKVVEFNVYEGQTALDTYTSPIEISFKFSEFGIAPEDMQNAAIFRFNEEQKSWDPVGGIPDQESGSIRVKRTNLSQYTVMKSKKSFSDADNSWAKVEINSLLNKGIVSQTAKFEPKSLLTRGEFASWIANAYGLQTKTASLPFKDVKKDNANYDAIAAVYSQGLIQGKTKNTFDPGGYITEQEMAVIMGHALVAFGDKQSNAKTQSKYLSSLKSKEVASWAESDMALLMELGMTGSTDVGKGNAFVTKETAAAAFAKVYS